MIGKGWCVVQLVDYSFSEGHGQDGMVQCKCEGDCPEESEQEWTCAKNEVVDGDQCAYAGGSYCFKQCDHHEEPEVNDGN